MIPVRVTMSGWMRYRHDDTVADFDGARLISICGENGAGKSSIFDAITYALYGKTRLGYQDVNDLISEGADRLAVEFEFEQDGKRYLVRRGRTRKGDPDCSFCIWDEVEQQFTPIPGTDKKDGFDRQVQQIVRLTEPAFTSSFMLQQGEATEFIDAAPKDRFAIISSLIGLEEYERLEKLARSEALDEKKLLDHLDAQIAAAGDVGADTVERLRAEAESAAAREQAATEAVLGAQQLLGDAREHARLREEATKLEEAIAGARVLLEQKEAIERNAKLFEQIDSALKTVQQVKATLADAARSAAAAVNERAKAAAIDVSGLVAQADEARLALEAARRALGDAEKSYEAALAAHHAAEMFAQQAQALLEARKHLAAAEGQRERLRAEAAAVHARVQALVADAASARARLAEAEVAREAAQAAAAEAKARADNLGEQLRERQEAAKEATCSRCGQPIDQKAARAQVAELKAQHEAARGEAQAAAKASQAAAKAHGEAKRTCDAAEAALAGEEKRAAGIEGQLRAVDAACAAAAEDVAARERELGTRLKDVPRAAAEHARTQEALRDATRQRDEARRTYEDAQRACETAITRAQAAKEERGRLEARASEHEVRAAEQRKQAAAFAAGLGDLGEQALDDAAAVIEALTRNRTELAEAPTRLAELRQAREGYTRAAALLEQREKDIAAIPAAHRVPLGEAERCAAEAQSAAAAAKAAAAQAQTELAGAEATLQQVAALRHEYAGRKLRHQRLTKLAKMLGKAGLQGVLIASAITDIKNHANAFLKRLTGGSLELTIEESKSGQLELRAIDYSCMREARSPKVLSGSQKFRCAVAIASGIGQYAGAGGMRSIVIDEGFASLDADSQRLMVQELKELAMVMDRVIVVSHLEAFTDPESFPDRLVVQPLADGSSTIRRESA